MPCTTDGYPEPRAMDAAEQWVSLKKHHHAVEVERDSLREAVGVLVGQLRAVQKMFPGMAVTFPKLPEPTGHWSPYTYD